MNFVIPKKKRVVEKPAIDVSSLEPKATIEDATRDSPKFNTVKSIILDNTSDRQVHQFLQVEKVRLIKNPLLEYKYSMFKANLRTSGQNDAESYGFLLIGFDDEDIKYVADNGYSVGTAFCGDLGLTPRGVYLYRYVDLVTPSFFYKDEVMRIIVFKTLRGKSYAVGLGSTELEPTLECSSHVAASDHVPTSKKSRQQLHRQSAVYHYEYNKDMTVADVPSGVLPYAVVDIKFTTTERSHHSNIPPGLGYLNDQLYFYPVYEGPLKICSAFFGKATLNTTFEESNKPHGLDDSLEFTKLLKWVDAYDIRGVAQLTFPETWGLLLKHREVCVKNHNERVEKWKVRYFSHFVWMCNDPRFTTVVNAMRIEQCAAIAYSIDATTYVAFPSSQFSNVFGLPWLQTPSLHVLAIHANPLFYADALDLNCCNEETEIINKIPLGTAILDGDDVALSKLFESEAHSKFAHFPHSSRTNDPSPQLESPSQNIERASTEDSPSGLDDEPIVPLPPVPLPQYAGKSCLRSKPPQIFIDQPPIIGKSIPPPAPGRNGPHGLAAPRKTRIRWSDNVVDNENKCGKKLSNDRDEAVKAGLHGRAPPPKDLLTRNPSSIPPALTRTQPEPVLEINPTPAVVNKNKDLFQGVFSTIAKGGSTDVDTAGTNANAAPSVEQSSETTKNTTAQRRLGGGKNCIITSLPLPLFNRNVDNGSRETVSHPVASVTNANPSSEDELTICDMEIESGSEETPTPPNSKPSLDGGEEAVDFIDDHDEDYDAQFKCEAETDTSQQSLSPHPTTIPLDPTEEGPPKISGSSGVVKQIDNAMPSSHSQIVPPKEQETCEVFVAFNYTEFPEEGPPKISGSSGVVKQIDNAMPSSHSQIVPPKEQETCAVDLTKETAAPASPPPTSVSEMPENVIRLLELLRANQPKPQPQNQDTDLRKLSKGSTPPSEESGKPRRSRFDQPPPELADKTGFVPKPVPTASIGFVGNVPPLGSTVMDTDLRSAPPATLAFSIKKPMATPTLNPPAPLVFGDDEDDETELGDQQLRPKSDRKDRDDRRVREERKDRDDRKDKDERAKRWDKPVAVSAGTLNKPTLMPFSSETPQPVLPASVGPAKEKPAENSKLFHILSGARMLQSQRDKMAAEYRPELSTVQQSTSRLDQAIASPRRESAVPSIPSGSNFVPSIPTTSSSAASNLPPTQTNVLGTAFGLSQDVIQQLLKRSAASSHVQQRPSGVERKLDAVVNVPVTIPTSLPDAPASPDPEGPASPDAPASPDPEEQESNMVKGAHSEIPLDCWQPSDDKATKIITVRAPRRTKRPKDHDRIATVSSTSSVKSGGDDEEEEGEILSDEEAEVAPQPIAVIGSTSHNIHAAFAKRPDVARRRPETTRPPPLASTVIPPLGGPTPLLGIGRGYIPEQQQQQPFGQFGQHRSFPPPPQNNVFRGPQWPPYPPIQPSFQGSNLQGGLSQQDALPITVIVPDFMMFNRAAMTRMDPAAFESFCERLKIAQTQENRLVSLQIHERLLIYVREMMQTLAGSEAVVAFQIYHTVMLKYKEFGIVHIMERHACDDRDVCTAQMINCFTKLRRNFYPNTVFIYMSNMSPSSSTGVALSAVGVRVMPPSSVMHSFGLDPQRLAFQS
ncbi:hypothetical protein Q1695_006248 [Nippostrongylus brasiliensis]|nr:hypothetical protein Q1695_006248 [Nippostrongylus brasiliensis]